MIDARHAAQQFRSAFSECVRRAPTAEKAEEIRGIFQSVLDDAFDLISEKRGWKGGAKKPSPAKKKAASKKSGGASDDGDS